MTVVVKCLTHKIVATAAKSFDKDQGPLLAGRYVDVPYGMTQLLANTVASPVNVTIVTSIALPSFIDQSVKKITWRWPAFVLRTGSKMFFTRNLSGSASENRRSSFC